MFLKSLVLRGFKSFADKTTLVFEPGITIVVGPNGSGKSNVVDAISWVLGEQGPRSLRGGKMEDVIFAGSRLRPALGMAEVSLTIDNSSGILPIEFTEVTISRLLFRSGDSEYRLNGAPCRLLDIQEVLSDSGIGREQHTIIGQGQLDAVLSADPMEMRGFIEEAAGVAKHRRRKERALRKIGSTEQNLVRLGDLLAEIRRQLRPLREQAEVAKRHAAVADEFSRLRLIMAARELADVRRRLGGGEAIDFDQAIASKERELSDLERNLAEAEEGRGRAFASSEEQRESAWSLVRSSERLESIIRLAAERARTVEAELAATTEAAAEARVSEVARQIDETQASLGRVHQEVSAAEAALDASKEQRDRAAADLLSVDERLGPARASERDASRRLVEVKSELAATSATLEATERDRLRVDTRRQEIETALARSRSALVEVSEEMASLEGQEQPLAQAAEELQERAHRLAAESAEVQERLKAAERLAASWTARAEVRASSPEHARRIAALGSEGVVGILSDLVDIPDGLRSALEALMGPATSVLVVEDPGAASRVATEAGDETIGILVAQQPPVHPVQDAPSLVDVASIPPGPAADSLSNIYVAGSVDEAAHLAMSFRSGIFITSDGTVASGRLVIRGAPAAMVKAAEEERRVDEIQTRLSSITTEAAQVNGDLAEVNAKLNELDAAINAATERMAGLERDAHGLERELHSLIASQGQVTASASALKARLSHLEQEAPRLERDLAASSSELERIQQDQTRASMTMATAASAFDESRVALRVATEGRRLLEERLGALRLEHAVAVSSSSGVAGRREELEASARRVAALREFASTLKDQADSWAGAADEAYRSSRATLAEFETRVSELRLERAGLAGALDDMRVSARREDLGRSESKIRGRILEERIREEWGEDPDELVRLFGHIWDIDDPSKLEEPLHRVAAMDVEAIRRRHAKLERDLEQMGRVNPLAAQEFDALTAREEFLASQIADVRSSRRDLFKVVNSVDEQIKEMFSSAYEDVAREYERLFAMLFPGGQGRLRLTHPTDMLETGVEVEARPGGKNLKRLSLLSGGERALSALAVLFAIFRARPSPFYVLDEVEAALDDVNLHRFLGLLKEFRESSQLLVVSHQKRTMEIADVLYGVSIKPDGASRVISEKLSSFSPVEIAQPVPEDS